MYAIGEIDIGGYIFADLKDFHTMMHRETRVGADRLPYATLRAAREDFTERTNGDDPRLILAYTKEGGVEALWCPRATEEVIRTRLKLWSGCYGTWTVRRLSEPVPAV